MVYDVKCAAGSRCGCTAVTTLRDRLITKERGRRRLLPQHNWRIGRRLLTDVQRAIRRPMTPPITLAFHPFRRSKHRWLLALGALPGSWGKLCAEGRLDSRNDPAINGEYDLLEQVMALARRPIVLLDVGQTAVNGRAGRFPGACPQPRAHRACLRTAFRHAGLLEQAVRSLPEGQGRGRGPVQLARNGVLLLPAIRRGHRLIASPFRDRRPKTVPLTRAEVRASRPRAVPQRHQPLSPSRRASEPRLHRDFTRRARAGTRSFDHAARCWRAGAARLIMPRSASCAIPTIAATPSHLDRLEAEHPHLREVAAEFRRPVMMYSIGKGQLGAAAPAAQGLRPARPPIPLLHRYRLEVPRDDRLPDRRAAETGWNCTFCATPIPEACARGQSHHPRRGGAPTS